MAESNDPPSLTELRGDTAELREARIALEERTKVRKNAFEAADFLLRAVEFAIGFTPAAGTAKLPIDIAEWALKQAKGK